MVHHLVVGAYCRSVRPPGRNALLRLRDHLRMLLVQAAEENADGHCDRQRGQ